ncbi:hypothetical protein [Mycoplasma struthionis]|uniref:DUF3899 domain-containing protein n=1 Tax=Mycoplasma struthionis TaxID=538220 RepID=A0A3G8LGF5_9MOLU|nr:hypothetical protein [Mycoplasma struthionis]AZG68763.1 hypothetical protein EGN60_02200 [Mycoplasma struthionis]TPI01532.1 hypothetical protein FJM01_02060 [Mycoplasma struthionis]
MAKQYYNQKNQYWKRAWNLSTTLYFFISLVIYVLLVLIIRYAFKGQNQKNWQTAISISFISCLCINAMVVLVKKGLGRGLFHPLIDLHHSRKIHSKAKEKIERSMSQQKKDQILNQTRREYEMEQNKKAIEKEKNGTNNLVFYLLCLISLVVLLALVPFFALHISF